MSSLFLRKKSLTRWKQRNPRELFLNPCLWQGFLFVSEKANGSVVNEIEFDLDQTFSIRTDVKLSRDDVKQVVSEAPDETLEEIVYQSLVTDELYLRAKEVSAKLKQLDLGVKTIEYWDDEGNKV